MYGFEETTSNVSGGKFGLNSGVFITKFEYNALGGANGAEQDCIDLTVQVDEKEYRTRFYPVSKVYGKEGGELTDKNSEDYKEAHKVAIQDLNARLTQVAKCFVSVEDIKAAFATPIANFKDYATILERLVKSVPNWDKVPVDVFLEYQWKPSQGQTRTYLQLPKKIKHGDFICKSKGSGFVENQTGSLKYVNSEGIQHLFKRSEWYMDSPFANAFIESEAGSDVPDLGNTAAGDSGWA